MTKSTAPSSTTTVDAVGDDAVNTSRMSFADHLDELRSCLVRALLGVVLGTILCLFYAKEILQILYQPLLIVQQANDLQPSLQALAPPAAFLAYLKVGFLAGLLLTMPWVLYQVWRFVALGLYAVERRFVAMLVPISMGLFVVGALFLYCVVLPIVLNFFISFNKNFDLPELAPSAFQRLLLPEREPTPEVTHDTASLKLPVLNADPIKPEPGQTWINATRRRLMVQTPIGILSAPLDVGPASPTINSQFALDFYISFVLMLTLAFGIAFETPIVVLFLARTGIVPVETMAGGRRYVLLGTVVAAAMLTPPDVISQVLLAGPMYLLFEVGLLASRFRARKSQP